MTQQPKPIPGETNPGAGFYKDLCIDANDPVRLGRFYADLLGRDLERRDDGLVVLTGPTPAHTVWVNPVPEPRTVKHRVHLDVAVPREGGLEQVLDLGATVVQKYEHWTVLHDPEGGELCVFGHDVERPELYAVTFDADRDRAATARWWAAALGGRAVEHDGWSSVEDVPGLPFPKLLVMAVPEPKSAKNRVHLDLTVDAVADLVAAGARVLREPDGDISWTVLADPDGNELCAFER